MENEITDFIGREVYSNNGVFVGEVEDVQLNIERGEISGLAIINVNQELFNKNGKGVIVPYRWVSAVGDIVIIKDVVEKLKTQEKKEK